MRIQFQTEGGFASFPGLSRPVTIDTQTLPEEEAGQLERLVHATRFFDRPATAGSPPRRAADYRQYTITVEEGGRRHTVQLADPVEDADLLELLKALQAAAARERA
jgi:Emfourin